MHPTRSQLAAWGVALFSSLVMPALTPAPVAAQDADVAVERAAARGPSAIVIVRCGSARVGTAFSFGAPERLATAWHVVDCPRALSVETFEGRLLEARVSANDAAHDLAFLVVSGDHGGAALTPLVAAEARAMVGQPVTSLGFDAGSADEHALFVASGSVGQVSDEMVRSDVRRSFGSVGGPLLDAQERVVAVIVGMDESGVTNAVPIAHLAALEERADETGDVRSPVRFGFGVGLDVWAHRGRALVGGDLSLSVEILDQLVLRSALGLAAGGAEDEAPFARERTDLLLGGSFSVGYRLRVDLGDGAAITFEPYVGVWGGYTRSSETTYALGFADPACNPSAGSCAVLASGSESVLESWDLRPTAGLRVRFLDALEIGYELQLDVARPEDSTHVITIGAAFGGLAP